MDKILVVEDTDPLREVLCAVLEREGFSVYPAPSAEAAIILLGAHDYSCVLSDFKLPGMNGIDLLKMVRLQRGDLPFVLMTAYGSVSIAVDAMKCGANDYISKPFEPSGLAPMLREVIRHRRIIDRDGGSRTFSGRQIVTESTHLQKILKQAEQAARVDTSVLILGESGTGKELMARFIHAHSPRRDKPFVAVNCAAIPPELLESEFFGHEAGAFTGATQGREGVLEYASEGTIFLDEVGDMPPSLQVKLLRALQEREIRRVGSTKNIRVNPRIVAATNKVIPEAMAQGSLREDFYYRIAVVTFTLPPLRERKNDISVMSRFFVEHFCAVMGREVLPIDPVAADMLEAYPWPGNARELENVIERAVILAEGSIKPENLGIPIRLDLAALEEASRTLPQIAFEAAKRAEVDAIRRALEHTDGNKSKAAILLGVSYKTLLNKIRDYELGAVADVEGAQPTAE